jgi:hypothetical protein
LANVEIAASARFSWSSTAAAGKSGQDRRVPGQVADVEQVRRAAASCRTARPRGVVAAVSPTAKTDAGDLVRGQVVEDVHGRVEPVAHVERQRHLPRAPVAVADGDRRRARGGRDERLDRDRGRAGFG